MSSSQGVVIQLDQVGNRPHSNPDEETRSYNEEKDENRSLARGSFDKDHLDVKIKGSKDSVDGKNPYQSKKNVAEANANQLRFLITYNMDSKTFYFSVALIVLSLILQVSVGIALIFKVCRQMKNRGRRDKLNRTNDFLVGGVFMITVINVFVASFTTTETAKA
ncbi:ninjurin-1 isoform X3 [Hermetia illucens]|uniref:ninjurin-1 isoform X3 n=1 Tax=Hermetia illucens TaxID=343691 RepID=UPI0018CC29C7|nr:ninjurin-1 isoform X3 [Hermetia illucens]